MESRTDPESRRDPERILREISEETENGMAPASENGSGEGDRKRGRLKIFFGYAAGVGKTYAMLDAAQSDRQAGKDVVAGYIEPHARPDTIAMLEGLECLPPLDIEHKGIHLKEFDLDAALVRSPELILVDEMAHTNAAACRHKKRWQDIQELLDAGIDVYTTVNVQHLESLHDIVASITHVRVNERVPDRVFDEADKIELVDTPPEELLTRMQAGKIYQGERAARAMGNFFSLENLTALREIALRRTADQVNRAVMRQRQAGGGEYYTGEHVLVCVSPAPSCEKVIRTAARMASAFQAQMSAVVVVRPGTGEEQEKFLRSVEANLSLATQFSAHAVTLYGDDVAAHISDYARQSGVSKIVIGRTVRQRGIRGMLNQKNLIDKLIELAPGLDVYVIPDMRATAQKKKLFSVPGKKDSEHVDRVRLGGEVLAGCGLLVLATLIGLQIERFGLGESNLVMAYILAVILTAGFSRYRTAGIVTSLLSVLLYNIFFTQPKFSLHAVAYYPFTFLVMLICALTVSSLAARLKNQVRLSREESQKLQIMISFSNKLGMAEGADAVLRACGEQMMRLLGRTTVVYTVENGQAELKETFLRDGGNAEEQDVLLQERERAVAFWVMKNCHRAGRFTDTLPEVAGCYFPVKREGVVYGVLGIWMGDSKPLRADERNLMWVLLDEAAVTLKACGLQGHL